MRNCPFSNCDATLADSIFACRRHWHMLTPKQKQTIHAAYADYKADQIGVKELRRIQQSVLDQTTIGGSA
jgi:hypothetical protein